MAYYSCQRGLRGWRASVGGVGGVFMWLKCWRGWRGWRASVSGMQDSSCVVDNDLELFILVQKQCREIKYEPGIRHH